MRGPCQIVSGVKGLGCNCGVPNVNQACTHILVAFEAVSLRPDSRRCVTCSVRRHTQIDTTRLGQQQNDAMQEASRTSSESGKLDNATCGAKHEVACNPKRYSQCHMTSNFASHFPIILAIEKILSARPIRSVMARVKDRRK